MQERANARAALNQAIRSWHCDPSVLSGVEDALAAWGPVESSATEGLKRLVVYGTLGPGGANHHVVAGVPGSWTTGVIEGVRLRSGWAVRNGYPAVAWDPGGESIDVHVLTSDALHAHWARLDAFEGPGYRRLQVPVFRAGVPPVLGTLYEARAG